MSLTKEGAKELLRKHLEHCAGSNIDPLPVFDTVVYSLVKEKSIEQYTFRYALCVAYDLTPKEHEAKN